MIHPLVSQLRFARSEFQRCLEGVTPEEALRRFEPMNCISWMVGHMANHEHRVLVIWSQGKDIAPGLNDLVGYGKPASTPALEEIWETWQQVMAEADKHLDTVTDELLDTHLEYKPGKKLSESFGLNILRITYHYWFHTGEAHAVRQMLGHTDLPQFVGDMGKVRYR